MQRGAEENYRKIQVCFALMAKIVYWKYLNFHFCEDSWSWNSKEVKSYEDDTNTNTWIHLFSSISLMFSACESF